MTTDLYAVISAAPEIGAIEAGVETELICAFAVCGLLGVITAVLRLLRGRG